MFRLVNDPWSDQCFDYKPCNSNGGHENKLPGSGCPTSTPAVACCLTASAISSIIVSSAVATVGWFSAISRHWVHSRIWRRKVWSNGDEKWPHGDLMSPSAPLFCGNDTVRPLAVFTAMDILVRWTLWWCASCLLDSKTLSHWPWLQAKVAVLIVGVMDG